MGVSLILLRRARTGIGLSRCGWVCVYAPVWPGTSFWGHPFLDLRPEKCVGGWGWGASLNNDRGHIILSLYRYVSGNVPVASFVVVLVEVRQEAVKVLDRVPVSVAANERAVQTCVSEIS